MRCTRLDPPTTGSAKTNHTTAPFSKQYRAIRSLKLTMVAALISDDFYYQSSDLVTWSRQNDALTPVSGTMISTSNIVERPKGMFSNFFL